MQNTNNEDNTYEGPGQYNLQMIDLHHKYNAALKQGDDEKALKINYQIFEKVYEHGVDDFEDMGLIISKGGEEVARAIYNQQLRLVVEQSNEIRKRIRLGKNKNSLDDLDNGGSE